MSGSSPSSGSGDENSPLQRNDDDIGEDSEANDDGNTNGNSRRVRRPVQYYSINTPTHDASTMAVVSRYKYYSRLSPHRNSNFQMPDHVVPPNFFSVIYVTARGEQNSIITIFSLWNTMMGTSILSMPWAIRQAGFVTGITLLVLMAGLMLYTSYRILTAVQGMSSDSMSEALDFSDVCRHYLGRWAQILAVVSSLLTLMGGAIVYWILMSNFLYNIVTFIYHKATNSGAHNSTEISKDYICPHPPMGQNGSVYLSHNASIYTPPHLMWAESASHTHDSTLDRVWQEEYTVPLFLIAILFPLINFKSPTFFTKFNSLGTISVTYLVIFVAYNASQWGFHLDLSVPASSDKHIPMFKGTFAALTGVAALAYFVQNCVISIVRNQKHPENNVRDLVIAYILVGLTYIYMGVMFYSSFPMSKDCIEDNLLNNMADTYALAFVARIGLFFQMMCVFPLLLYIFRVQFLHTVFGSVWPSLKHVLGLNFCVVAVCVLFAMFLPHIGSIIGFVGAFCGLSYAIALPCLVYMVIRYQQDTLTMPVIAFHSFLILIGLANFVGQFIILGKTS
ncbi:sodium-coupled neutral amino acid transporter 9-like [Mizuhopecten yessoensis]|uniref:Amino acid permease F13H10.3 n=1 Tax=Mizuhopecten yessoensis TaxID=6573 RepID=A0A210QJK1_MIZYE|nr:sodium-coupled neutral amino acid transporter 9-like [Mizuhopecten yessoensis]OWF48889.1 amino acid permease F13H10.3 [Mizuhopecten yessoensis]